MFWLRCVGGLVFFVSFCLFGGVCLVVWLFALGFFFFLCLLVGLGVIFFSAKISEI